jgi:hypothetical protein
LVLGGVWARRGGVGGWAAAGWAAAAAAAAAKGLARWRGGGGRRRRWAWWRRGRRWRWLWRWRRGAAGGDHAGGVGSVAVSGPRLAVDSVAQAARLFVVSEGFPAQSINNRMAAAAVRCGVCVCMPVRVVSLVGGVRAAGVEPAARLVVGGGGAGGRGVRGGGGGRARPRPLTTTLRRWRGLSAGELGSGACVCGKMRGRTRCAN